MGKKKSAAAVNNESASASPPSIFKSLFGEVSQKDCSSSASIFSETNPFRRRRSHNEAVVAESGNGGSEAPPVLETKSRKRKGEECLGFGSDSVAEGSISKDVGLNRKKSKKIETESLVSGLESIEKASVFGSASSGKENQNLGFTSTGDANTNPNSASGKKEKKKMKRKRDEIEMEYEEKRYGGAVAEKAEEERVLGGKAVGEKRKTVDNAVETMVPKEGFDDESKLLKTVFVGNLPLKVKKKALLKEFGQFGEIESLRVRSVPIVDSKIPRKGAIMKKRINESVDCIHAYVVFKTEESAQASLTHNMSVVEGNHIRVDRACPPRKKMKGDTGPLYDNKRTVFVGNLPFDVKDEEIYQLFSGINNLESSVEAVRVIRDPNTSVGKGIAYVLFKTREAANKVAKKRNLKLRDRELRLSHAKSESTPSKRKSPSASQTAYNSPAKKFASDSRGSKDSGGRETKTAMSYQGLRASKSGAPERASRSGGQERVRRKSNEPMNKKLTNLKRQLPKERTQKRPAVAAKKAKQLAMLNAGASKVAGQKRKLGNRTPVSAQRNKKARKSR